MSTNHAYKEDLQHWLANEDWYPSQFTSAYFARTLSQEANDTLAEIAQDANLEKLTPWSLFTLGFAAAGFTMSFGPAGPSINDRKAGVRAALYLAERGDVRCLPALARVWARPGLLQSRYQEQIAQSLIDFLQDVSPERTTAYRVELAALARRVWTARPLRRDLPDADAALLIASIPHLPQETTDLLRRAIPGGARQNRGLVQAAILTANVADAETFD